MQILDSSSFAVLSCQEVTYACRKPVLTAILNRSNDAFSVTTGGDRFTKVTYAGSVKLDSKSVISGNHRRESVAYEG